MSIFQKIIDAIECHRDRKRKSLIGAHGQFWRDGGNELLYDLPVAAGGLIIDAGGYKGEWTKQMVSRYSCRSQIFEPVPEFFEHCRNYFKNNTTVQVHKAALGAANRKTTFCYLENGTSEHCKNNRAHHFQADVIDVARIFGEAGVRVACLKLNIEGAEYEVLERIAEINNLAAFDSLLIQFHRQPDGYESRYKDIVATLHETHIQSWCYEMVWEKWVRKNMEPQ